MNNPKVSVNIKINGEDRCLLVEPQTSLLKMLRDNYYWDVKCGCEEGDCGTCTVLLDGVAVKSCVTLAAQCDGHEVWTDYGLGQIDAVTQCIQEAFVECGAIQCGFCTPGMIVAATDYIKHGGVPDRKLIRQAISGNLCRCTGYQKIVDAIYLAAQKLADSEVKA